MVLDYKNYRGSVHYSEEDGCYYGKVLDIRSLISYEGKTIEELKEDFEGAVEDYLDVCQQAGIIPENDI